MHMCVYTYYMCAYIAVVVGRPCVFVSLSLFMCCLLGSKTKSHRSCSSRTASRVACSLCLTWEPMTTELTDL